MNQWKHHGAHIAKNENAIKRCNDRRILRDDLLTTSLAENFDESFRSLGACDGVAVDLDNRVAQLSPFS